MLKNLIEDEVLTKLKMKISNSYFLFKVCRNPPLLKNGNFSIKTAVYKSMYLSGTIIEYTCDDGFILYPQEDSRISCNSFGEWESAIGKCYPG